MKVIISVDYSSYTDTVLQAAHQLLATRMPVAEILVVHIIDQTLLAAGTGAEPRIVEELQDDSRMINEMARGYFGSGFTYLEEYGVPQVKIDEILDNNPYDLLVIGTRGRSVLSGVLLGSMAEHLLHHTKKPLLIVPR
jgi:nucleotide-binding universal stress UspA family protein